MIPDRLSVNKSSPDFDRIYKRLGVRFDGEERSLDVQAYSISEGWIDVEVRGVTGLRKLNEDGTALTKRLHGLVEPFFKQPVTSQHTTTPEPPRDHAAAIVAAELKRQRKAEKLMKVMG